MRTQKILFGITFIVNILFGCQVEGMIYNKDFVDLEGFENDIAKDSIVLFLSL